jgi:DNA-binding transcriptional LysR family regulator
VDRFAAMTAFVSVVDAGSFSAAARRRGVGQPALSKAIAQLESRLGVRLLLRSTRGLTPTEAGLDYYERATRALQEAEEAEVAARGAGTSLSGRLRVCAAVTFARLHVIPHLPLFLEQHPQLSIDLVLDDRLIDLLADGIDVALRMGTLQDSSLIARKISNSPRRVLATSAYWERNGEPRRPADLANHEVIVYDPLGEIWQFTRDSKEVSVRVRGRINVSAAEGVRAAVLSGMGVTAVSEWMFAPELKSGLVRAVLDDWPLPDVGLWAVYPSGHMPTTKARAFAAFVEEQLKS